MTPERRALRLLDLLYQGGFNVDAWPRFARAFSDELGGAAVAVTTDEMDWENPQEFFWTGLNSKYAETYQQHAARGLPWGTLSDAMYRERFCRTRVQSDGEISHTAFYREWMRPQGLACESPLAHVPPFSQRRLQWKIFVYRVEGGRAIEADDVALCNYLVPHLATNALVFDAFSMVRRQRIALAEVVDRIPNGIFLVDSRGGLLVENLGARRILETDDGLSRVDGCVHLADPASDVEFRRLLKHVIAWRGSEPFGAGGEFSIERPSGKRAYVALVTPMSAGRPGSAFGDDVAAVLIADVEADQSEAADHLRRTCELTDAEVARLLAEGMTLEEVSRERGVTINTTRTQLKRLLSKTGAGRQSELVAMVLSLRVTRGG